MPCYKILKDTVGKHKQLYYKINYFENEFFRINSLDRTSACLTGSGILYLLQRHTSQAAVLRLILCPPHWDIHWFGGCSGCFHSLQCTSQEWYLLHSTGTAVTGKLASSAAWHYTYLQLAQFCPFYPQFRTDRQHYAYFKSIYSFRNTMYAFYYNLFNHPSNNIPFLAMNSFDRSNSPLCSVISNLTSVSIHKTMFL